MSESTYAYASSLNNYEVHGMERVCCHCGKVFGKHRALNDACPVVELQGIMVYSKAVTFEVKSTEIPK